MLNPEPLSKSIKLQPLNLTDQFYTPLQTNFIVSADTLYTYFNIFKNTSMFLYMFLW